MAVTITLEELAVAMRAADVVGGLVDNPLLPDITRLFAAGRAIVERRAPDAPDAIQNEALVRLTGYLFDAPLGRGHVARGQGWANAWLNSGAADICSDWIDRRGLAV